MASTKDLQTEFVKIKNVKDLVPFVQNLLRSVGKIEDRLTVIEKEKTDLEQKLKNVEAKLSDINETKSIVHSNWNKCASLSDRMSDIWKEHLKCEAKIDDLKETTSGFHQIVEDICTDDIPNLKDSTNNTHAILGELKHQCEDKFNSLSDTANLPLKTLHNLNQNDDWHTID